MSTEHVNGVDIHYRDEGAGPVVVLMHGLGSSNRDWDLQYPVLVPFFRVIAPDFRAHGKSTHIPKSAGVPAMTEDVYRLLRKLEVEKATFVGFSMGGAVAFEMAAEHPELVDKLVIINSGPDFNAPNDTGVDILAERTKIIKEQGFLPLAEKIVQGMFPEPEEKKWRDDFKSRIVSNDEDAYLQCFGALMQWGLGERVRTISQKTLILASDQDYTPIAYKESYRDKMPDAKLVVIKNSRHGVVLDAADQLNKELLKFLKNG